MDVVVVLVSSAVMAALVSGVISLITWRLEGGRADKQRRRDTYAKAFAAYKEYMEYPYRIRRRSRECPEQRAELVQGLSALQRDLAYYEAWIETESVHVAERYCALTAEMRRLAGSAMSNAWQQPGATTDTDMNTDVIDTTALRPLEAAYLQAVRDHLS